MDSNAETVELKKTSTVVTFTDSSIYSSYDAESVSDTEDDASGGCKACRWLRDNLLLVLTMVGILVGLVVGFLIRLASPTRDTLLWVGLPGELFLRMLKMMILPLIVSNVITGTASLGAKSNGKMGVINLIYIVATNLIGCVIAVVSSFIINSGSQQFTEVSNNSIAMTTPVMESSDIFVDLLRNLFPDNLVDATLHQVQTKYIPSEDLTSNRTHVRVVGKADGTNLIGIIVCAILFGVAASTSGRKGRPFLQFFSSTSELVMVIIRWFLWYSPIGIASLMINSIGSVEGELGEVFTKLGFFILAVTAGLLVHQVVVLPAILFAITRRNPYKYLATMFRAWLTAFATTSGAMAMPDLFKACEETNKIDRRVTSFSIPFTVTLNADGSVLYIVTASLFIAQLSGISLDASQITILVFLTSVAGMALPSIPSSSIVTIVILLSTLGIPGTDIALLFTVEWLLDRLRTACNVMSHGTAPAIVYALCRSNLQEDDDYTAMKRKVTAEDAESQVTFAVDLEDMDMSGQL